MGGQSYADKPGYTGWRTRDLLRLLGQGATIITTDPRWPSREVEYKPRELREQFSWHVKGEDFHSARTRATFCQPVNEKGEPWSLGEAIRTRLQ